MSSMGERFASPEMTFTRHRPQVALALQAVVMARPACRATANTLSPSSHAKRRPDGRYVTEGNGLILRRVRRGARFRPVREADEVAVGIAGVERVARLPLDGDARPPGLAFGRGDG